MKELKVQDPVKLDKQETRVVYVYEKGVEIGKFVIVVNCNNHLIANRIKNG